MLNGNGALDTQTHRLIKAWVTDLPTTEMQAIRNPAGGDGGIGLDEHSAGSEASEDARRGHSRQLPPSAT
jgi:hypothetical protein